MGQSDIIYIYLPYLHDYPMKNNPITSWLPVAKYPTSCWLYIPSGKLTVGP